MEIMLDDGAKMPKKAHATDVGYDIFSPIDVVVPAHRSVFIDSGVHIQIPIDVAGVLISKSGLNVKHGITSTGLIDPDYTGSIGVKLYNNSGTDYKIAKGDKITQIMFIPYITAFFKVEDSLDDTERGDGGFNMCNIKGKDLHLIVNAVVALAQELGMLDEEREVD